MLYVSWLGSMQILQFIEFILILTNSTLTLDYSLRGLVLGTATLVLILGSDSSIFSLFERGIVARGIAIDRVFAYCLDWIRLGICNLGLNSTQIVITVHQLIATVMQVSTLALWLLESSRFPASTVSFGGGNAGIGWVKVVVGDVGRLWVQSLVLLKITLPRWYSLLTRIGFIIVKLSGGVRLEGLYFSFHLPSKQL